MEQGFYKNEGFEVTLVEGGSGINTIDEVINGNAEYGVTNSELLLQRLNGKPLVAMASIFQHSPLVFVARSETGITSPQDLYGKFVMMNLSSRDIELQATLQDEGIDLNTVVVLDEITKYEDYFDPTIDALAAYITNQPYFLKQKNIPYNIINPTSYGVDFYGDGLFTTEQEIAEHPERAEAIRRATLLGWEYAMDNPEEIIETIISKYKSKKSRDHLLYEAEEMRKLILPEFVKIGHMNPGRWRRIAEIFLRYKLVPETYSLQGFIYSPEKERVPKWFIQAISTLAAFAVVAIIISFFLFLFNRRLKKEIIERKKTERALQQSEKKLLAYSQQTEQFSLSAASIISIRDEKKLFAEISKAIVEHSDFNRVLISLFRDQPPYRELLGNAGVSEDIVKKVRETDISKSWYSDVFSLGTKLGHCSYYVPHTLKGILNEDATFYGNGTVPKSADHWHPEDNLFVRMNDEKGEFIGIISVDSSKSGEKPTDEVVRPLEIYSSLISQIIILKREHSRRQQLEQQLRHSQKMDAIGKLTGGIAHDFNNLLGIIVGNTELALLDTPEWNPCHKNLATIKTTCLRAKDIVQHLLTFSRKSEHELRLVKIAEVLRDSLRFLRSTIPPGIMIDNRIELNNEQVFADPPQIYQMLLNLCTNSVQAMKGEKGQIHISAQIEYLQQPLKSSTHLLEPGPYIRIEVTDTGHGIDPALQEKIFDPYYTTKGFGNGAGLGLSIVHGIILNHDGAIHVENGDTTGVTFIIHLPVANPSREDTLYQEPSLQKGTETILLIDDDTELLHINSLMLEKLGYTVVAENLPDSAYKNFQQHPENYDLVITDMTMPEMDGSQLAQKILEIRPEIPIFLCTGYSDKINEHEATRMGITRYFQKPLDVTKFSAALRSVFTHH
nr:ABC transporter substrate-binding protein [Desulfosediminicola flagellatus]